MVSKLLGTLARYGWKPGVHKNEQFGFVNSARTAAGLGQDPLTKWEFFVVTETSTWGANTKAEANKTWKDIQAGLLESKKPNLPRRPMPPPQKAFKTRRNELDRKTKHKGNRFHEDFELDIVKRWGGKVEEDAPANAAGGGGIAGIGIGSKGEPGIDLRQRKKKLDDMTRAAGLQEEVDASYFKAGEKDGQKDRKYGRVAKPNAALTHDQSYTAGYKSGYGTGKLNADVAADAQKFKSISAQLVNFAGISAAGTFSSPLEQAKFQALTKEYKTLRKKLKESRTVRLPKGLKEETFAGARVFEVDMDKVMSSRFGKNRYHRYSKYVGEDEKGEEIRQHGRTRGSGDIILKDSKTAIMTYLRRKKPVG